MHCTCNADSTHQGLLQELFGVKLILCNDVLLLPLVVLIQAEPDTTKVEFLDETFADLLPVSLSAPGFLGAKHGPISVVEQDF